MDLADDNSTVQFKQQFDLLSTHTPEYEITVPYIVETVVSNLPQCRHFIDVGTGRGNLAKSLSNHFDVTTIVEPNQLYHDEVLAWARQNDREFYGKNTDWLNANIAGIQADLVLMSHVLYYVDKQDWSTFIRKAYDALNPGGQLVFILNSLENSVTYLYKQFMPKDEWLAIASSEGIHQTLQANDYANVTVSEYYSNITTDTLSEMYELIDFLLLHRVDFADITNQEIRKKYCETYLYNGKKYVISADGHILSIRKPL